MQTVVVYKEEKKASTLWLFLNHIFFWVIKVVLLVLTLYHFKDNPDLIELSQLHLVKVMVGLSITVYPLVSLMAELDEVSPNKMKSIMRLSLEIIIIFGTYWTILVII